MGMKSKAVARIEEGIHNRKRRAGMESLNAQGILEALPGFESGKVKSPRGGDGDDVSSCSSSQELNLDSAEALMATR